MPNEIKAPKVLKETIKEVYELMKAENLLLEFDRRTVLRLIIEALSVEDIQAMTGAKDDKARNKLYKELSKKYHPDKNPDNKEQAQQDFNDLTRLYKEPSIADVLLKKAGAADKPAANQQAQGNQKDVSPEVVQNVGEFLKKTQEKYHKLYEQMQQVIKKFAEEPAAFFADEQFVNNLVSIAQSLNEQKEGGLGVELKDGDLKGNIERIIAGLEKIRQELLQALSKKAQLAKQRPQKESGEEQKQLNEEDLSQVDELDLWLDDNKEKYEIAKEFLNDIDAGKYKSGEEQLSQGLEVIDTLLSESKQRVSEIKKLFKAKKWDEASRLMLKELEEVSGTLQKYLNQKKQGKNLDPKGAKQVIELFLRRYELARSILQFANDKEEEKQDSKPMPLVPAVIDKVEDDQPLTIVDDSGNDVVQVTKQEADATYDIITAADKFVRIYELLFQLIQKKISLDKMPLPKKIDLSKPPQQPRIDLTKVPFIKLSLEKEPIKSPEEEPEPKDKEPEEVTDDDKNVFLNGPEVAKLYVQHLQFVFDDFEESFLNVPLLNVQSQMYSSLIDGLEKFRTAVDKTGISALQPDGAKGKPGDNVSDNKPQPKQDTSGNVQSTDESIISQIEKLLLERRELEFDDEDMSLFKTEYKQLLKLAKMLDKIVNQIKDAKSLETFGGTKLEAQARKAAQMVQDSIAKVHDVASNELKQDIEAGKTLKEQEEEQKPPTPFDRGDSSTNTEKRKQRRANFEDKVAQVKKVYERVVNQLTLLNQFVDRSEKEDRVDGKDFFNYLDVSEEALESIRQFFPSQSPFGKKLPKGENPDNYVKKIRSKMKTMVRDIIDLARQLQSLTSKQPAPVNEEIGAIKDVTDSENVTKMVELMLKLSAELQDIFDAPSKISKVFAQRGAKVKNLDKAAAMNEKGEQAAAQGKAEKPDLEEQEASGAEKEISTANDAITSLKSSASDLNRLKDALTDLPTKGPGKQLGALDIKEFLIGCILYLNDFSKKEIKEELEDFNLDTGEENKKLNVGETPITKMMKLSKEKIIILNRLMANDKADIIEKFFGPLMQDKYAVTLLNKRLEAIKKKDPQTFKLSYKEAQQLLAKLSSNKSKKPKDKDEKQKDKDFKAGNKFGDKVKSFFNEDKVEKQLERIIEQYLNTGKL